MSSLKFYAGTIEINIVIRSKNNRGSGRVSLACAAWAEVMTVLIRIAVIVIAGILAMVTTSYVSGRVSTLVVIFPCGTFCRLSATVLPSEPWVSLLQVATTVMS